MFPSPDQEGESIYNCGEPAPLHVGRLVHLDLDAGRGVVLVHTATEIETLKKIKKTLYLVVLKGKTLNTI